MTSQLFDLRTDLMALTDLTSEEQTLIDDSFSQYQVSHRHPFSPARARTRIQNRVIVYAELSELQWAEAVTYLTEVGQAFSKLEKEGKRLLGMLGAGTADPLWPTLTFGCV
jgi:hypothetical protein